MDDQRVIYLGKSEAIDANQMEGFTPTDLVEIEGAVLSAGLTRLAQKINRARKWTP